MSSLNFNQSGSQEGSFYLATFYALLPIFVITGSWKLIIIIFFKPEFYVCGLLFVAFISSIFRSVIMLQKDSRVNYLSLLGVFVLTFLIPPFIFALGDFFYLPSVLVYISMGLDFYIEWIIVHINPYQNFPYRYSYSDPNLSGSAGPSGSPPPSGETKYVKPEKSSADESKKSKKSEYPLSPIPKLWQLPFDNTTAEDYRMMKHRFLTIDINGWTHKYIVGRRADVYGQPYQLGGLSHDEVIDASEQRRILLELESMVEDRDKGRGTLSREENEKRLEEKYRLGGILRALKQHNGVSWHEIALPKGVNPSEVGRKTTK